MNKKQIEILDKCIGFISSPEKLESFLNSLGERDRKEIIDILKIAKSLYMQAPPSISAEKREEIKAKLLALSGAKGPAYQKQRLWIPSLLKRALATITALILLGSGVAIAANKSLPDNLLYPIKRATERARLAIARREETRARLEIGFAKRRLEESQAVLKQPAALQKAVESMAKDTSSATQRFIGSNENTKGELANELVALTEKQQEVLSVAVESAPETAKSALLKALTVSRHGHEQAIKALTKEGPAGPKIKEQKTPPPSSTGKDDLQPDSATTSSPPIDEENKKSP